MSEPRRPVLRTLGIDPGTKRIGLALGVGDVASPHRVVRRSRDLYGDLRSIVADIDEFEVAVVVVGLPLGLDGRPGAAARAATSLAEHLARLTDVPVEMHDERLTTVTAERSLLEAGLDARRRREVVDKVAAAVMLQSWLDSRSAR